MTQNEEFKPEEVARLCRVSTSTIQRRIRAGELEAYKAAGGRDYRVPRGALLKFLQAHRIPLPPELGGTGGESPAAPDEGPVRVLVVDDDERFRTSLERHLKREGKYRVETAWSGLTAGIALQKFRPQVVLLDILLGDVDGRELIRTLRADPALQGAKVIAMSGYLKDGEAKDLRAAGFDDYLAKPFKLDDLDRALVAIV